MMRSNTKIQINSANSDLILQAHIVIEAENKYIHLSIVIVIYAYYLTFSHDIFISSIIEDRSGFVAVICYFIVDKK